MRQAFASEQRQFRLALIALPAASALVLTIVQLTVYNAEFTVSTLYFYGLGLGLSLAWTFIAWWPLWKWFHRNGYSSATRVPFIVGAGALMAVPFAVFTLSWSITFYIAIFGALSGLLGSLAMTACNAFKKLDTRSGGEDPTR
jgi:hypothetical protein